ncbi:MAG: hypothetical protein AB7S81_03240 [Bdellovibrionales bacterium]
MSLPPELEQYRAYTKNFDMSDQEKDELIQTTWILLQRLVDQSFGFQALQENERRS